MKSYKKILLLFVVIFTGMISFASSYIFAQSLTWQRLYNGPSNFSDIGYDVCQTMDSNFIVVGSTRKMPHDGIYVLKLNKYGDTIWTKIIANYPINVSANAVTSTNDGGCVLTGDADTAFAIKLDISGNIVWSKRYGLNRYVQCYDICNTLDRGFIACGSILSGGGYVFKIDSLGNLEWEKIYVGEFTFLTSIDIAHNSGYILSGSIYDTPTNDTLQAIVIRIDEFGNTIWSNRFLLLKGLNGKRVNRINSGYILSGTVSEEINLNFFSNIKKNNLLKTAHTFFIRLDSNGNNLYSKIFYSKNIETLGSFSIVNDNKYLFALNSDSANYTNAKLIITDFDGNIINQKTYQSIKYLYLESAKKTFNGSFIFAGTWGLFSAGNRDDIYGLSTDSNLNAPPLVVNILENKRKIPENFILYPAYPNPFNPFTRIKFELKVKANVILKIFNIEGKEISELINENKDEGIYSVNWGGSKYGSGIFFCEMLINRNILKTIKLIILK